MTAGFALSAGAGGFSVRGVDRLKVILMGSGALACPLLEGILAAGRDELVAVVERKSLADLAGSLTSGRLAYRLADLAGMPRAALVVEDRYSSVFKLDHVRPALVAEMLAECQVRWPSVPILFLENRTLAQEWTYRFLGAAVRERLMGEQAHRILAEGDGDQD